MSVAGIGAASGALWGMLFALLLLPLAGMAIGAATGAIVGKRTDVGIDDKFIKDVGNLIRREPRPPFLYVVHATTDWVVDRLKLYQPTVLRTSLSHGLAARHNAVWTFGIVTSCRGPSPAHQPL
jgi:uncharacterized membrane protein